MYILKWIKYKKVMGKAVLNFDLYDGVVMILFIVLYYNFYAIYFIYFLYYYFFNIFLNNIIFKH